MRKALALIRAGRKPTDLPDQKEQEARIAELATKFDLEIVCTMHRRASPGICIRDSQYYLAENREVTAVIGVELDGLLPHPMPEHSRALLFYLTNGIALYTPTGKLDIAAALDEVGADSKRYQADQEEETKYLYEKRAGKR